MGWGGLLLLSRAGSGDGVFLGNRRRRDSWWCVSVGAEGGGGLLGSPRGASVVWSWGGGGRGGWCGVALLVAGQAGVGAVLDGSLSVMPGCVGVVCACRAVLPVSGFPRCRGTGGRWLPGHLGEALVRRQRAAVGGWCLLAWVAEWGGSRWWWGAPCSPWCCPRVFWGARWHECREPVQWGR